MITKYLKSSKAKTGLTVFALMLILLFIGLNFQNCSNMTSSSFGNSSSAGVGGTEITLIPGQRQVQSLQFLVLVMSTRDRL